MVFKAATYDKGIEDALSAFGVRVASEFMARQRMPEGPEHLGAERLSKLLRTESEAYKPSPEKKQRRNLENTPRWGTPTSLEGASTSSHNAFPGMMGLNGGV
jgi:hypothetical protein